MRVSLWEKTGTTDKPGQALIPSFIARASMLSPPPLSNYFAPLLPHSIPTNLGKVSILSGSPPRKKPGVFAFGAPCRPFLPSWVFQLLSLYLQAFFVLSSFCRLSFKTDSLAKTLINTFALRCKWLVKDMFLLPGAFVLEQRHKFRRVEFQISKPGGRGP